MAVCPLTKALPVLWLLVSWELYKQLDCLSPEKSWTITLTSCSLKKVLPVVFLYPEEVLTPHSLFIFCWLTACCLLTIVWKQNPFLPTWKSSYKQIIVFLFQSFQAFLIPFHSGHTITVTLDILFFIFLKSPSSFDLLLLLQNIFSEIPTRQFISQCSQVRFRGKEIRVLPTKAETVLRMRFFEALLSLELTWNQESVWHRKPQALRRETHTHSSGLVLKWSQEAQGNLLQLNF